MSTGSKSSDALDEGTCAVMEASMLEEEGYFDPAASSGAGVTEAGQRRRRLDSLCRVCANASDYFIPIFEGEGAEHQLDMKIQKHLPIQVIEADCLPAQVCYQCASTLIAWHDLVTACVEADKKLHQLLQDNENDIGNHEEKVVEFFNEPPVDSEGDDFNEPSTSTAVVEVRECLPAQKRRISGKGKQHRKANVDNVLSESDVKSSTALSNSTEACADQKEYVESASSTERSSMALKTIGSASVAKQETHEYAPLITVEKVTASGDEDNGSENGMDNFYLDYESNAVWFPIMHSYCKTEMTVENDALPSDEQLSIKINSHSKSKKRVKPHIIELESFGFPLESELCDSNILVCHICGECISGAVVDMEEHLMSHGIEENNFECGNEQFGGTETHGVEKTDHECDDDLQILEVENVPEFCCKMCEKWFENKIDLKFHVRKCHRSSSGSSGFHRDVSSCDDQTVVAKRKRSVFMCHACKSEFPDFESLEQHRPVQAKKCRIEGKFQCASSHFLDAVSEAQPSKKYVYKKHEQAAVSKRLGINKMVRKVCGDLLAVDTTIEQYLFKQLRKEQHEFKTKQNVHRQAWRNALNLRS